MSDQAANSVDPSFLNSWGEGQMDWQMGRSVLECNRYMLEHGKGADVTIDIGPENGPTERLMAHRYMLIARSPVFEAMLCRGRDMCVASADEQAGFLRVVDADVEAFREMLRFMYYESAAINASNVTSLLYLSKKYLLADLTQRCYDHLESHIAVETVCSILNAGILYSEPDLIERCLRFIGPHMREVIASENWLELSRESLDKVVGYDFLYVNSEIDILKACLHWATERCFQKSSSLCNVPRGNSLCGNSHDNSPCDNNSHGNSSQDDNSFHNNQPHDNNVHGNLQHDSGSLDSHSYDNLPGGNPRGSSPHGSSSHGNQCHDAVSTNNMPADLGSLTNHSTLPVVGQSGKVSAANIRRELGDTIYRIRLPNLSTAEFARHLGQDSLLSEGEKCALYYHMVMRESGQGERGADGNISEEVGVRVGGNGSSNRGLINIVDRRANVGINGRVNHDADDDSIGSGNNENSSSSQSTGEVRNESPARSTTVSNKKKATPHRTNTALVTSVAGFDVGARVQVCERFASLGTAQQWWSCNGPSDAVCVQVDRDVDVVGLGVYGGKERASLSVSVYIHKGINDTGSSSLITSVQDVKFDSDGGPTPVPIYLPTYVRLRAQATYTLVVNITGPLTHYGTSGREQVTAADGSVTFRFLASSRSTNGSNTKSGQIPQIIYKLS